MPGTYFAASRVVWAHAPRSPVLWRRGGHEGWQHRCSSSRTHEVLAALAEALGGCMCAKVEEVPLLLHI